ncbi:baseplate J/gp47 family protein [Microbispora sp. NPDC049125]|uniref:baseplate J/gp47 family protein n=1 Tax=Microbispora sp. NPDC049125 TaxID=3154929 RepID=UPI003465D4D1
MTELPYDRRLRLQAVQDGNRLAAGHGTGINGIESIEVDGGHPGVPPHRTLLVHCLLPVPSGLDARAVRITGGVRVDPALNPVRVEWAMPATRLAAAPDGVSAADAAAFGSLPDPERVLVVRTSSPGDFSTYRFAVTGPALGFDPRLAEVPFSFTVDCPTEFDPRPPLAAPVVPPSVPQADYLSRDYESLRGLLLDRLSLLLPGWTDRDPADLGVTLVELFAYLGDQLAYAQDAVGTEAYLGTARRRVSIRRHARLLDYPMHEGAAARTWLVLGAGAAADGRVLETGTEVVTAGEGGAVFHTLHPVTLASARDAVEFHTWSEERLTLPAGATGATLVSPGGALRLRAGDVLVLEEVRGADGRTESADPSRRLAVRLIADPVPAHDPVTGTDVIEVAWHQEDALPFPLRLWRFPVRPGPGAGGMETSAVVRGNVVLAEHGALVGPEPLEPAQVPVRGRHRPRLRRAGLTHAVPYDHRRALTRPASAGLAVPPSEAVPALVEVHDGATAWTVAPDLLDGDRFAARCAVETEDDGRAYLRFGDGICGHPPTPGAIFLATYRVGGGRAGNVGREALTRLARPIPGVTVRNPMPAEGGIDPEPVEQVRQWAPQAFRVARRAVTDADYAEVAARHPQVRQASASRRWTGSWYTESVVVDRRAGLPADQAFRGDVALHLEPYRMAGEDVRVTALVPVSLDIVLTVRVAPGHLPGEVKRALVEVFTAGDRADGTPGFFHPLAMTFGEPVYLSRVVAAAMAVRGVLWVDADDTPPKRNRFQRWGRPAEGERAAGRIAIGPHEVARCLSDPSLPEHGRIDFLMEGGS